jgi:hypothetical protein
MRVAWMVGITVLALLLWRYRLSWLFAVAQLPLLFLRHVSVRAREDALELRWLGRRYRFDWPHAESVTFKHEFIGGRLHVVLRGASRPMVISSMVPLDNVEANAHWFLANTPAAADPAPLPAWLRFVP